MNPLFNLDDELDAEFGPPKKEKPVQEQKKLEGTFADRYEEFRKENPGEYPDKYVSAAQFKAIEERESMVWGLESMTYEEKLERQDKRLPADMPEDELEIHLQTLHENGMHEEVEAIINSKLDKPAALSSDEIVEGLENRIPIRQRLNIPKQLKPEVDYTHLSPGMKEAHERNGVKDHGLGIFDNEQSIDRQDRLKSKESIPVRPTDHLYLSKLPEIESFDGGFIRTENITTEEFKKRYLKEPKNYTGFETEEDKGQPSLFDEDGIADIEFEEADQAPQGEISKQLSELIMSGNFLDVYKSDDGTKFKKKPEQTSLYENVLSNVTHEESPSNLPKAWVGIDPGKAGGIVAITEKGIVGKWVIPLIGKDVDAQKLWLILNTIKEQYNPTLILEEVHSLHKMSASTNFSMGHTLGLILGIVIASKIRLIRVQPKAWQKEVWITSEIEYLPKTADQVKPSVNTKLTSIKAAHRLFPNVDFRKSERSTNPHDGICDGCCMAEYGRRKNL